MRSVTPHKNKHVNGESPFYNRGYGIHLQTVVFPISHLAFPGCMVLLCYLSSPVQVASLQNAFAMLQAPLSTRPWRCHRSMPLATRSEIDGLEAEDDGQKNPRIGDLPKVPPIVGSISFSCFT